MKPAWVAFETWNALSSAADKGELNSLMKMLSAFGTSILKVLHKIEKVMVSWGSGK